MVANTCFVEGGPPWTSSSGTAHRLEYVAVLFRPQWLPTFFFLEAFSRLGKKIPEPFFFPWGAILNTVKNYWTSFIP